MPLVALHLLDDTPELQVMPLALDAPTAPVDGVVVPARDRLVVEPTFNATVGHRGVTAAAGVRTKRSPIALPSAHRRLEDSDALAGEDDIEVRLDFFITARIRNESRGCSWSVHAS